MSHPPSTGCVCAPNAPHRLCLGCKKIGYCCRNSQLVDWEHHKRECQILRASATMESSAVAPLLIKAVDETGAATYERLSKSPLVIGGQLKTFIEGNGWLFTQGEWVNNTITDQRFLCTASVLTCVTVFAFTDSGTMRSNGPALRLAFGAHVDAECYLRDKTLKPLLRLIRDSFGETPPGKIFCTVVGGHARGNPGRDTLRMGRDICQAIRSAGFQLDTHLFELFPGATQAEWERDLWNTNFSLYKNQQCFFFVGLDVVTGRVLAHTRFPDEDRPAPMWPFPTYNAPMGAARPSPLIKSSVNRK